MAWTQADVDQWNALPGFSAQIVDDELVITMPSDIIINAQLEIFSAVNNDNVSLNIVIGQDDPELVKVVEYAANLYGIRLIHTETPNRYLLKKIESED